MQFQKLSAPSLKELFVAELENKILSGELKIGEKLPSERELAVSMQVSRAVVNSGIAELEQKGFLVIKPRIGTFVADYRKYGTLDTLVSIMKFNGGTLQRKEIKSILELRMVLVALSAKLAIENASDEELASLLPILDAIKKSTSRDALVENVFAFYHELGFISGNTLLPLFIISFKELVCKLWQRYIVSYGEESLIQNTEKFARLLLDRSPEALHFAEITSQESIDGSKQIYES